MVIEHIQPPAFEQTALECLAQMAQAERKLVVAHFDESLRSVVVKKGRVVRVPAMRVPLLGHAFMVVDEQRLYVL